MDSYRKNLLPDSQELHPRRSHLLPCIFLSLFASIASQAEESSESVAPTIADEATAVEAPARRPRVGLVLGGGGARGAAHIGVLKELERMRVPIDVVVGTSMGAVVGGLYATGMTVVQLEETVSTLDWAAVLSDRPARKDLSFRRKLDDEQFPINFEIGYSDGELKLPQGVIQGHNLDLVLRKLTLPASGVSDFDELPIPFRAIATDIVAGERYVMGEGDLATAIRASMSVPGAFAPVLVDGHLLVDGGLVGNLGVSVVQEMDVDVVIAVDVEFPMYEAEALGSALAISEQVLTLLIRKETLRQIDRLGPRDILIRPDLGTFASTNFQGSPETIGPGAESTRAVADQLAAFAVSAEEYAEYLAERTGLAPIDETLQFVRVVHDAKVAPKILEARMDVKAGDPINADALSAEADRLYGLRLFEKVGYKLVEEDGRTGVEFQARSKSWGPNYFRFGVSLEEDFEGSTGFNIMTRWRRVEINSLGAELLTDLQLGTDPVIRSEFYQPLRFDSRIFVAPTAEFKQSNQNVFVMDDTIARLRVSETKLTLAAGSEIGTSGEFRAGLYHGAGKANLKIGNPALPDFRFDTGGLFTRLRFNTFDHAQFPKNGIRSDIEWISSRQELGADDDFDTVTIDFSSAWTRGRNTLIAGVDYATTLDSVSPVQNHFPLGGFLRLSGLERGQISGPHSGLLRLVFYRQVGGSGGSILAMPMYLGASVESGNVWQDRDDVSLDSMLLNGSLFLGLDTFIGPLYLAAGFGEDGHSNVYLFIGASPK
jgi:NTE family protein